MVLGENDKNKFKNYLSEYLGGVMAVQYGANEHLVKNRNWNIDFSKGHIYFGTDCYRFYFLGSESYISNTWLWGWDNVNNFNDSLLGFVKFVKSKGEKEDIKPLYLNNFQLTNDINGHTLSIAALSCFNACYYRCPYQGGAAYILILDSPIQIFNKVNVETFSKIVLECISKYSLNHKLFVESFLKWNKTKYKWNDDFLIAQFSDNVLKIEFAKDNEDYFIKKILIENT